MLKNRGLISRFQDFDAYAKTLDDFRIKTTSGATVTMLSVVLILYLVYMEFCSYLALDLVTSISVDPNRNQRMLININVTLHKIPCYLLSMHLVDISGQEQGDISHVIFKQRVDKWGNYVGEKEHETTMGDSTTHGVKSLVTTSDPNYCGSCYGGTAPNGSKCCNTCDDVQQAYLVNGWALTDLTSVEQCVKEGITKEISESSEEGCNMHGHVDVLKVSGKFYFQLGKIFQFGPLSVQVITGPLANRTFDYAHTVHSISFGDAVPGAHNTLDSTTQDALGRGFYKYQYFLKVVGTHAIYHNGSQLQTNQYSATFNQQLVESTTGLEFNYEISPMVITYREHSKSLGSFLTNVCAIVGGIFTVASILDAFIYRTHSVLSKKMELGKVL